MAQPSERQLLNAAYHRYRLASQLSGYTPLPLPLWLDSLRNFELVEAVADSERDGASTMAMVLPSASR